MPSQRGTTQRKPTVTLQSEGALIRFSASTPAFAWLFHAPPRIAVARTWDRKMKEPWCLATTLDKSKASEVVQLYGRRFTIEETFRDQKDLHFGMGLKATHIRSAARRDRLLLLAATAQALMTLLGAAAEEAGLDRYLKVNTVKRRTHSLFRQGLYWYHAIPNMRREWLVPLMTAFDRILREHAVFREIFGAI